MRFIFLVGLAVILAACAGNKPPEEPWVPVTHLPGDSTGYPNPFSPTTSLDYSLGESTHVRAVIYNVIGVTMDTLIDSLQGPGQYTLQWIPDTAAASGIYFVRWYLNDSTITRKLLYLR